ncbi:type III PLP-dependent enzyme [Actinocorallia sp. B10E7]|uniref:type III PLP-dependent enzyme n=1 Tax=Actinocorallia sp. B10E7 TaxID=3153558 RepID=UPI00325E77DF
MDLARLAREHGTPLYVYDRDDLRRAHSDLRSALPDPSRIYFSVKANPHPHVASVLAEAGCHAEIASAGEVGAALAAGFPADRVLMTGPGKSPEDLRKAFGNGVRRFSVDSPTDLARIGAHAARAGVEADCLLRVNADEPVPGMGLSMTGTASVFGADASWVLARPELFRRSGAAVVRGLHLYMGTNIEDGEVLFRQFETSLRLAGLVGSALGVPLAELDLGGGFGMPYARSGERPDFTGLRPRLEKVLDHAVPGWQAGDPLVSFESGRYLAGGCGRLVNRVLDVKESKGRTFVVLDSGINHLGGMSGLRRIPRIVPDLLPVEHRGGEVADCTVAGPLCTPLDTWCQGVTLPELRPGDLVAVPNVGAYGLTAGLLAFLGHPAPKELVLDAGSVVSLSEVAINRDFSDT